MPTIAIIGAGSGLGAATARRFGREGFDVALISRSTEKRQQLIDELAADGINAFGFTADVLATASLIQALEAAENELGSIDVLQYSPLPSGDFLKPVLETTPEDLAAASAFSIQGPVAAIRQILPGMRERGHGTIILVNGGSAVTPNKDYAGTSIAFAGESAYGSMLHEVLAPEGIHVGQLIIPGAIDGDDPLFTSESLADRLWQIHVDRGDYRVTVSE